jgi:peptidoglycan/xylan/chitin deacetylase (PgdA/CDA1 family)
MFSRRLLVLGYHNVDSTWRYPARRGEGIRVLARQLRVLRRNAHIVPLEGALRTLAAGGSLPSRAVAVTFDDGYRDNLTQAVPLLARLGIPATIYLVPGFLSGEVHAWWERLAWAIDQARAPYLEFDGTRHDVSGPAARVAALDVVEAALKTRDHAARLAAVEELVEALEPDGSYRAEELFLDWDGARELTRAGIAIGSHTMRHAILAREDEQAQRADLAESRRLLEAELQVPVDTLAYPNGGVGDYDAVTISAAQDAGYTHAVTAWGLTSSAATPPYEISRKMASPYRSPARMAVGVLRDFARST